MDNLRALFLPSRQLGSAVKGCANTVGSVENNNDQERMAVITIEEAETRVSPLLWAGWIKAIMFQKSVDLIDGERWWYKIMTEIYFFSKKIRKGHEYLLMDDLVLKLYEKNKSKWKYVPELEKKEKEESIT